MQKTNYMSSNSQNKTPILKYTSHIRIIKFGEDSDGNLYVKLLVRRKSIKNKLWISISDLTNSRKETYNTINRFGGHIISLAAQRELETRLQFSIPKDINTLVATKIGWLDNNFIMPDEIIGVQKRKTVILLSNCGANLADKYICSGTPEGAKQLMALAHGNSRFMLAISLAFLGPLADLAGQAQVAVQLFGKAATGKTALAVGISSIYGWHVDINIASQRGFAESWNLTINSLEQLAVNHSGTFLILDEANTAPMVRNSRVQGILDCVFRLDQSQERGRLYSPRRASWWMPVLSISNMSLEEMAIGDKIPFKDEARDRLIEVPLPTDSDSIFEMLHSHKTLGSFVAEIKRLATLNHGVLGREYIRCLCEVKERDPLWLPTFIAARKEEYLESKESKTSDLELHRPRLREKFSMIYAAGCLARHFDLVPWKNGELRRAIFKCELAHVAHVQSFQKTIKTPAQVLTEFVNSHTGQFRELKKNLRLKEDPKSICPGFINSFTYPKQLFILEKNFRKIFTGNFNFNQVKAYLAAEGIIKTNESSSGHVRFVEKRTLGVDKAGKKVRPYVMVINMEPLNAAP